MNHIKLSFLPENYISLIMSNFIRLDNVTQDAVEAIEKLNAFTDTDIIDNKKFWKMHFSGKVELAEKFKELNRLGFLFVGGGDGWPPSEIFVELREKKFLKGKFKEVTWRGPDDWVIRER